MVVGLYLDDHRHRMGSRFVGDTRRLHTIIRPAFLVNANPKVMSVKEWQKRIDHVAEHAAGSHIEDAEAMLYQDFIVAVARGMNERHARKVAQAIMKALGPNFLNEIK